MYGKFKSGIIQLLTLGGLGIWSVIDLIMLANQIFKDNKGDNIQTKKKVVCTIATLICIIIAIIEAAAIFNGVRDSKRTKLFSNEIQKYQNYSEHNVMQIFIHDYATQEEIEILKNMLNEIDGIKIIDFKSKEDAYNEMAERLGDKSELLEDMESEIFSASYVVTTKNPDLINKIERIEYVKSVTNNSSTTQILEKTNDNSTILRITFLISVIYRIMYTAGIVLVGLIILGKKKHIV